LIAALDSGKAQLKKSAAWPLIKAAGIKGE